MFSPATVGQSSQIVGEKSTEKPAAQDQQPSSNNPQPNGRPKTAGADQQQQIGGQQTPILHRRHSKLLEGDGDQHQGEDQNGGASREPSVTFSTRNKCNGIAGQKKAPLPHPHPHPHQQQMAMDSPPSAGGHPQRRRPTGVPPLNFNGGSQFDAQSLQARRSRSFAASHHQQMSSYPNGGTPSSIGQQHNSMPMRCGSCSNLSLAGLNGGGQLVLYEGGTMGQETAATQRHSMILPMDVAQLSAPIWYQPMPGPPHPPPPPPFYYTAATLPHPGTTPLDYKAFKHALKESERLEKKQRKIMMAEFGDETFGGACCEFCCGGSALILWLVISLVALGFLGFLLMAIYFV